MIQNWLFWSRMGKEAQGGYPCSPGMTKLLFPMIGPQKGFFTPEKMIENDVKPIFRRISMKSLFSIIRGGVLVTLCLARLYQSSNQIATPVPVASSQVAQFKQNPGITQGIPLLVPHTLHTATRLLNGRILVVGGYSGNDMSLTEVDLFDPMHSSIRSVASLHTPRQSHSATLLRDGRVLVVGGYNPQQTWLADAEVYDPLQDTWTVVSPLYSHGT